MRPARPVLEGRSGLTNARPPTLEQSSYRPLGRVHRGIERRTHARTHRGDYNLPRPGEHDFEPARVRRRPLRPGNVVDPHGDPRDVKRVLPELQPGPPTHVLAKCRPRRRHGRKCGVASHVSSIGRWRASALWGSRRRTCPAARAVGMPSWSVFGRVAPWCSPAEVNRMSSGRSHCRSRKGLRLAPRGPSQREQTDPALRPADVAHSAALGSSASR